MRRCSTTTGGHQLKINKASASDTASLLYQDAFSGRAEFGLAGDDDFHFKVSPNGNSWKEAIVIDRATASSLSVHYGDRRRQLQASANRWLKAAAGQPANTAATTDSYYVADQLSVHR